METKKRYKISKEIKEEILNKIKNEGLSVSQVSKDYGVATQTIYSWLTKGASNNPTLSEFAKLKRQNKELLELVGKLTLNMNSSQKKT